MNANPEKGFHLVLRVKLTDFLNTFQGVIIDAAVQVESVPSLRNFLKFRLSSVFNVHISVVQMLLFMIVYFLFDFVRRERTKYILETLKPSPISINLA